MTQTMKPCPFCGSTTCQPWRTGNIAVMCPDCGANGPPSYSEKSAIKAWNIRADLVTEHLEAIMQAVEDCDLETRKAVAAAVREMQ